MTSQLLLLSVTKEVRALLPVWLAAIVAVVAGAQWGPTSTAVLVHAIGAIALGAQSIGHEYTHRTLALLLSHPLDRRWLFVIKEGVVVTLLLLLAIIAGVMLERSGARSQWTLAMIALPPAAALLVTPWLTMTCRRPLGGVVFTISLPAIAFLVAQIIGRTVHGPSLEGERLAREVWFAAMAVSAPLTALLGWRHFTRLELVDGGSTSVDLAHLLGRDDDTATAHPIWLLVKKELHLQQMAVVVAVVYIAGWIALSWTHQPPEAREVLVPLYFVIVSLLVGSLASAEERQLGTIEWQLLLPMAAWKQWATKVAVVMAVALLLGLALPAALGWLSGVDAADVVQMSQRASIMIVLLTAMSLYMSSLSSSGVRALAVAFPVMMITPVLGHTIGAMTIASGARFAVTGWLLTPLTLVVASALVILLLWFAFVNHCSADRNAGRVARQVTALAGVVALAAVLLSPL